MSTPPMADAVAGPNARRTSPFSSKSDIPPKAFDAAPYIEKIHEWNNFALQPWRIAMLVRSDRLYAVLERKELVFDLLDWFEDTRVGAVMRGEKVLSEEHFWIELYRHSSQAIEKHFGQLPVRVVSTAPSGHHHIVFGTTSNPSHTQPIPSPIASHPAPKAKKRHFKTRP